MSSLTVAAIDQKSSISKDTSCETLPIADDQQSGIFQIKNEGKGKDADSLPETIIVDWEGPDDPTNPKNWTNRRKWEVTVVVSLFTFISPLSSSMAAPASLQIARDLNITNTVVMEMTTSVFVLGFALGPLVLGPLSEIYGRSRVSQMANLFFLVWNLACGFAQSTPQLIAFRLLAGLGGSAPLSIGGGTIGDIWRPEERGKALAIYALAPLLGPVLGPICGAWIAQRSTWRWVYWSASIADAFIQLAGLFYFRESFAPVLLERKAIELRQKMDPEKGNVKQVRSVFEDERPRTWKQFFGQAMARPFILLALEPIVQLVTLFLAFIYGLNYLFLTSIPVIFGTIYHQPTGTAGLNYIALGIGLAAGSQLNARALDRFYVYFKNKNGGVGEPEFRLPTTVAGALLIPIGLFIAGWSAEARVHWVVTDIGLALVGAGMIIVAQTLQTYMVDAFTLYAASALAAATFLRSIAGFTFPLFAPSLNRTLGFGKADSILACCSIILGWPALWIFWRYGKRIRAMSRYARKSAL